MGGTRTRPAPRVRTRGDRRTKRFGWGRRTSRERGTLERFMLNKIHERVLRPFGRNRSSADERRGRNSIG